MTEKEIWKPVGTFKGVDLSKYLEASNLGKVKRLARLDNKGRTIAEMIYSPKVNKLGNLFLIVRIDNKNICGSVSQFVMNAFNPDHPEGKNRVRHIDGNMANNRLDNLEWASQKEICNSETFTQKQAQALKEKVTPIVQLDLNGNFVSEYRLRDDIKNAGFISEAVTSAINKEKYFHKGYIWMYKPDYENSTIKDIKEIVNNVNQRKKNGGTKNRKAVLQLDEQGNLVAEHKSLTQAAKVVGCTKQAISLCLVDPEHHVACKGFLWRYKK